MAYRHTRLRGILCLAPPKKQLLKSIKSLTSFKFHYKQRKKENIYKWKSEEQALLSISFKTSC